MVGKVKTWLSCCLPTAGCALGRSMIPRQKYAIGLLQFDILVFEIRLAQPLRKHCDTTKLFHFATNRFNWNRAVTQHPFRVASGISSPEPDSRREVQMHFHLLQISFLGQAFLFAGIPIESTWRSHKRSTCTYGLAQYHGWARWASSARGEELGAEGEGGVPVPVWVV